MHLYQLLLSYVNISRPVTNLLILQVRAQITNFVLTAKSATLVQLLQFVVRRIYNILIPIFRGEGLLLCYENITIPVTNHLILQVRAQTTNSVPAAKSATLAQLLQFVVRTIYTRFLQFFRFTNKSVMMLRKYS